MGSKTLGAHNEQRDVEKPQRTRPLRTYGKRTSSSDVAEPVSKKRRIETQSESTVLEDEATELARQPDIPRSSPTPTLPQPTKKGMITSYFKAIPSTSSGALNASSSEPSSEPIVPIAPTSTPPSSPPLPDFSRKKRRRLTTRAISRTALEDPKANDVFEGNEECEESDTTKDRSSSVSQPDVLSDARPNTLNRPIARAKTRFDAGKRGHNPRKGTKSTTVQTTLSLTAEERGFTECKECDMLYNPLHKQDAQCHARRHAAMLKAKSSPHNKETLD